METDKHNYKKKSSVIRRLILIVLGMAVGVNAYMANAKGLTGNQLPMPFGIGVAVVLSGSMEPTYSINDIIIVKEATDYSVGDVVVYQAESMLVVHRIIARAEDIITTQGDANLIPDNPISISDVRGVVIGYVPKIGGIIRIVKTPICTLVLIIGAILLVELSFRKEKDVADEQLQAIKDEIRRLKEEQEASNKKE